MEHRVTEGPAGVAVTLLATRWQVHTKVHGWTSKVLGRSQEAGDQRPRREGWAGRDPAFQTLMMEGSSYHTSL